MAVGGREAESALRRTPLWLWVAGGLAVCAVGVAEFVLVGPGIGELVGSLLVVFGALAVVTASLAGVVRRELRRQTGLVTTTAERWLTEVLPPARVLGLLLDRIYGPSELNAPLVTAVLGGEGLAADCTDLTISEHTEIDHQLVGIDDQNYQLTLEARYYFRNRVPTDSVVIFATCDTELRDTIVTACRLPLFELCFVREGDDTPLFGESMERLKSTIGIGVQFTDDVGVTHDVPVGEPGEHLRDVGIDHWGEYLSIFRSGRAGEMMRRSRYLDRLRIFEVDLKALANGPARLATIRGLTVRTSTVQQLVDGFCYWEAPYPCFVERMRFDTTAFDRDDSLSHQFFLKPFMIKTGASPPTWSGRDRVADLPVRCWLHRGHGMALMWRPEGGWTRSSSVGAGEIETRDREVGNADPPERRSISSAGRRRRRVW